MKKEVSDKLCEVKKYISNIESLGHAISLLYWDMSVYMPKEGIETRSNTTTYLAGEQFKLTTSDKVKEFIEYFNPVMDELEVQDRAMIKALKKNSEEISKIPEEEYKEYAKLTALSYSAWEDAKNKSDFSIFEPYLEKVVSFKKKFADYYGYKENRYDALLNEYEEGLTVKKLDQVFGALKEGIVNILKYVNNSEKNIDTSFLEGKFDISKQKEISDYLLDVIKFDKSKGRLDETEHPFTNDMGNKDVRITTHYYEDDLFSNIFSVIHEGGHALYGMHISDSLENTGLMDGASMAIHESQSRFYENIIGRSKSFLKLILPKLQEKFPQLKDVTLDELYKAVNKVQFSLIRTEADELTYSLHVIIRYEIEKQLINGEIEVKDLPQIWNNKYREYLGIEPKCDAEGVLQDMHWSDGSFGYFPSYALGNIYGGQFLHTLLKENENAIEDLDMDYINEWLMKNIHQYGAIYTPGELVKKVTGEELNTKYFLEYLERKYKEIY
ncbi:MAG: carboxypeptidase M32 [Clostridium sp.]|nr:carboxypeptidase M32 [Clostridium sp.]